MPRLHLNAYEAQDIADSFHDGSIKRFNMDEDVEFAKRYIKALAKLGFYRAELSPLNLIEPKRDLGIRVNKLMERLSSMGYRVCKTDSLTIEIRWDLTLND